MTTPWGSLPWGAHPDALTGLLLPASAAFSALTKGQRQVVWRLTIEAQRPVNTDNIGPFLAGEPFDDGFLFTDGTGFIPISESV